jgi:DinB family protein
MPKFFDALSIRKLKRRNSNNSMKQLQTSLLVTAALSLLAASAYPQAAKSSPAAAASPSTPPTIASAIDREISLVEKEVVDAAEAMPEDKFDFSPEKLNLPGSDYKGVRTFGEQLKHIAASNYLIWSPITGEKPPDTVNEGKGPDNMKAKADIIKFVKDSFAFGHKAVATLNDSNLVQPIVRNNRPPTTRLFLATFAPAHCFDHYGQMVEYLRMNGIVPPASRGQ